MVEKLTMVDKLKLSFYKAETFLYRFTIIIKLEFRIESYYQVKYRLHTVNTLETEIVLLYDGISMRILHHSTLINIHLQAVDPVPSEYS